MVFQKLFSKCQNCGPIKNGPNLEGDNILKAVSPKFGPFLIGPVLALRKQLFKKTIRFLERGKNSVLEIYFMPFQFSDFWKDERILF